jgi:hypothetical protein
MIAALQYALLAATLTATPAAAWHEALLDRVAADLRAGRPLVIEAHVALCSNDIINCGGHGLGDGDDLARNLYWATSGGFRGWFDRRGSGWTRVLARREPGAGGNGAGGLLETAAWRRRLEPGPEWRRRGVRRPFDVYVVALAWRGDAIDDAIEAYVKDLYGESPRPLTLDDGVTVEAGGRAHLVGYVGHNRWMDLDGYDRAATERLAAPSPSPRGTVVMACRTAQWLGGVLPSPTRVPLLMTRDFVFAGAHGFEGAASAFAAGADLPAIRAAAARAYAAGESKPLSRVDGAFTNPSDRRWVAGRAAARGP